MPTLNNQVLECVSHMCDTYTNNFGTSHVAYTEIDTENEEGLELAISIFESHQPPEHQEIKGNIKKAYLQKSDPAQLHTYPTFTSKSFFPLSNTNQPSSSQASNRIPKPNQEILSSQWLHSISKKIDDKEPQSITRLLEQLLTPLLSTKDATLPVENFVQLTKTNISKEEVAAKYFEQTKVSSQLWHDTIYSLKDVSN